MPPMANSATGSPGLIPTCGESQDDNALLAQVERGSEEALVALHRRYVKLVFSLSLSILGDPMATEEVTQDVFMKLWRHPRAYDRNAGRFSSWLLTVARHGAIDRLRRDGRRLSRISTSNEKDHHAGREEMFPKGNPGPELQKDLRIALAQLPPDQRQVIELAYFGGMSQQDIADYFGLHLGTVKTRVRLGMHKLRAMWQRNP